MRSVDKRFQIIFYLCIYLLSSVAMIFSGMELTIESQSGFLKFPFCSSAFLLSSFCFAFLFYLFLQCFQPKILVITSSRVLLSFHSKSCFILQFSFTSNCCEVHLGLYSALCVRSSLPSSIRTLENFFSFYYQPQNIYIYFALADDFVLDRKTVPGRRPIQSEQQMSDTLTFDKSVKFFPLQRTHSKLFIFDFLFFTLSLLFCFT